MNNQPHTHELQTYTYSEGTFLTYGDQHAFLRRWFLLLTPHPLPLGLRICLRLRRLRRRHDRSFRGAPAP